MSFGPDSQPRAKPFIFWVVYSVDFAEEVGSEKPLGHLLDERRQCDVSVNTSKMVPWLHRRSLF